MDQVDPKRIHPLFHYRAKPAKLELTEETMQKIGMWAAHGLSMGQIAASLGLTASHFNAYRKKHPEIDEAMETGIAIVKQGLSTVLYKKGMDGDLAAIQWIEKSRFGYSDKLKTENEHSVAVETIEDYLKRRADDGERSGREARGTESEALTLDDHHSSGSDAIDLCGTEGMDDSPGDPAA